MRYLIFLKTLLISSILVCSSAYAIETPLPPYLLPSEKNTIRIVEKMSPYVVNVHNFQMVVNPYFDAFSVKRGNGSGFLWNKQGYVITNYHLISGTTRLAIILQDGKSHIANLVAADPRKDIAVLKMADPKILDKILPYDHIPLANSDMLLVGQKTIAIGNPFGLGRTVTTGIISALGRNLPITQGISFKELIQTDASINPGNSGGPLFNSDGRLIGMNTVIMSRSGSSSGIGFAIPANTIKRIVDQIIKHGKIITPGIGIQPLSSKVSKQLGVKGVIIGKVLPHSPAVEAGLDGTKINDQGKVSLGDIIVFVNGQRVNGYDDYYEEMQKIQIGDSVKIKYLRNRKVYSVEMKTIDMAK
ncbi:MAG: S1C family serine protease [Gammaproteobacteria bacterium]